jgi:hypothetical protein
MRHRRHDRRYDRRYYTSKPWRDHYLYWSAYPYDMWPYPVWHYYKYRRWPYNYGGHGQTLSPWL